ncbi:MAG: 50S ribosomal protein L35 [Verrucomicrobiota bacterium]
MIKTRKSIAKRFKITGTGKLKRRTPGFRHLLRNKSAKSRRRAGQDKILPESHAQVLRNAITPGRK